MSHTVPSRYLTQSLVGGLLHGLRPIPHEKIVEIASEHPGIPRSYLAFISQIGTGSCEAGTFYIPIPIEELVDHQSYKLYRSSAHLSPFGRSRPTSFPLGAVTVADTGASWKYCFGPELGEPIYTFDLSDGSFKQSHASFDALLEDWLSEAPE